MAHDHDDGDDEYVCDKCGSVFDTLEEIKEHARDAHDADP